MYPSLGGPPDERVHPLAQAIAAAAMQRRRGAFSQWDDWTPPQGLINIDRGASIDPGFGVAPPGYAPPSPGATGGGYLPPSALTRAPEAGANLHAMEDYKLLHPDEHRALALSAISEMLKKRGEMVRKLKQATPRK